MARRFTEATGLKVRRSNKMYRSTRYPFMLADVDRMVVGEDAGLECKTASPYSANQWKDGKVPNTLNTFDVGESRCNELVVQAYGICSKDSNAMKSDNPHSGFYEADTNMV